MGPATAAHDSGLDDRARERYARQLSLAGWGEPGQLRLQRAHVFVAGAGGLGSPASMYLAVAGVGRLTVCDYDAPERSNLNRQLLHDESRLGVNKARSAAQTLQRLNPDIDVIPCPERITASNVDALVGDAQVIVDCLDSFAVRYLLNEVSIRRRIPLVHGGIWGLEGRLTFCQPPRTPCLRCLFPEAPPPGRFPVLGATPGVIGSLQAMETLKYLTGVGTNLAGRLLVWDGAEMEFLSLRARRDPACPACSGMDAGSPP